MTVDKCRHDECSIEIAVRVVTRGFWQEQTHMASSTMYRTIALDPTSRDAVGQMSCAERIRGAHADSGPSGSWPR